MFSKLETFEVLRVQGVEHHHLARAQHFHILSSSCRNTHKTPMITAFQIDGASEDSYIPSAANESIRFAVAYPTF